MNKIIWAVFGIITVLLLFFFLLYQPTTSGGDMLEYFAITETLIKNRTLYLTDEALGNLKNSLDPGYFLNFEKSDWNGGLLYYMRAKDGELYPVHFIFYSILALPFRLFLKLFQLNELNTLRITNLAIFTITAYIIMRYFLTSSFKRAVFLIVFYLSPLVWFLIWPGPDIYYSCLFLIAVFLFFQKRYILTLILTAFASWHSQPLLITLVGFAAYCLSTKIKILEIEGKKQIALDPHVIPSMLLIFFLASLPYLYNYFLFGILTPWTVLQDGWTQLNGFGLQNMSLKKLFEQFFDLNIGLFWYAPLIVILSGYFIFKSMVKERKSLFILLMVLITAFFYQTNPAWHYGTSGYGPTRHILFALPFLIYFVAMGIRAKAAHFVLLGLLVFFQLLVMSFNGFIAPDFMNTLSHSPYTRFVLDRWPQLYNPTPEIFIDRTNHTDLKFLKSAIYKKDNLCQKAYITITDFEKVKNECGFISDEYKGKFENDFLRKASYPRKIKTNEATFWPDNDACGIDFFPTQERPFVCMLTKEDVAKYTGVNDKERFKKVNNMDGLWKMEKGEIAEITVPPGYIIDYNSFEGEYVNY